MSPARFLRGSQRPIEVEHGVSGRDAQIAARGGDVAGRYSAARGARGCGTTCGGYASPARCRAWAQAWLGTAMRSARRSSGNQCAGAQSVSQAT